MVKSLEGAISAKRESKSVDFKSTFDPESSGDWCELIKDLVAMSNSGGGTILVGVNDDGSPSKEAVDQILRVDPAIITTKIEKYTNVPLEVEVLDKVRDGRRIVVLVIPEADTPIVFTKPGTYEIGNGKQKTAFGVGTVYFRHGAKSTPGRTDDIRASFDRIIKRERKEWAKNVKKVVAAPRGANISIRTGDVRESNDSSAMPIRITDDLNAPAYRKLNPDDTHPHRLKDLLPILNERFKIQKPISSHDIVCIRKIYGIDKDDQLTYKSKFGSFQYSDRLIGWFAEKLKTEPDFIEKVRKECFKRRVELGFTKLKK